MGSLSLRALLISSVLLTGIVPVVATSVYLQAQSKQAMIERSEAQLDANRVGRQEHVEHYLDMVRDQNSTLAHDLMTVEAMSGFRSAFPELGQLVDDQASAGASQRSRIRERVSGFYTSSFAPEYSNRNGESIDSRGLLPTTSAGLGAQYAYIANSPYPLGEKDKLERADSGLRYDALHERYHAIYRDFLQRFGYYDIFLVEPVDGTIVYSVFKELDYGTSLFNGPYRDTNFADVTRKAMALPPGQTAIVDYKQYQPSYDSAASFVAAPIYDADVLIGVLVFQMPVDRLNSILLEETGLGETGETLLLGQDGLYRSQSRFSETNSILNATIDSSIIALASSGEAGTTTVDMDGSEYIASYASLEHAGLDWLMIARIKSSEALSVVSALQQTMLYASALVALIVSVFGFFLAQWLFNKLGGDPQEILAIAEEIGAGDLSPSEDEATRTGAYKALVNMRAKLRDVLGKSNQISREVQTGATELSDGNMGLSERTEQQAANLEETASSTEELTSTVRQNADNARSARDLAHETSGRATTSGEVAAKAIEAMTDINSASEKISNIIGVIDEIAFQTNLLALNAAVEAARAGEQGRGFAVVATEVRQLAGRSASAAREIKDLIEDSVTKVKGGTELVQKSGDELNHIVTAISQLTEIVSEISSASEEQAAGIDQINQALIHMDSVTQQNAALVEQAAATSKSISDQSTELSSHISYFDTGVDHHEGHSVSTARAPVPARAVASAPRVAAASGQPTSSAQPAPAPVSDDGVWEEF